MAEATKISVRLFIETALRYSRWRCPDCRKKLEQVWIGEEECPDLHYIHCPSCGKEFDPIVAFVRDNDIPEGR